MTGRARVFIVAYDVRCPKRWRRVFKRLKQRGAHSQLSVFLVRASRPSMARLGDELRNLLLADEDSLLIAAVDPRGGEPLLAWGRTASLPVPVVTII